MKVLHITNMWPTADRPASGTFVKTLVDALEREGVENVVLAVAAHRSRLEYLRTVPRMRAIMREHRFDLIHAQYAHCILLALTQHVVPVVAHFHGEFLDYDDPKDRLLARLADRSARHAVAVDKATYLHLKCAHKAFIPIGIDPRVFVPGDRRASRVALGITSEEPLVLFPSDPRRPEKRYQLFRQAVELVASRISGARELVLDGYVHEQVPLVMNAADVMLMTSKVEASPTVVKEALLCNLPVVATPAGDTADLLADVVHCHVVDDNAQKLAEHVEGILKYGVRSDGRKKLADLSIDTTVKHVLRFYSEALASTGTRPTSA